MSRLSPHRLWENHEGLTSRSPSQRGGLFPHQKLSTAGPHAGVLQMAVRRVYGEIGESLSWGRGVGGVLWHAQWPPTRTPAAYEPMQGPAQLCRLAGGVEAGDVVAGAEAQPGAASVRVPALPNLWDVGTQQILGSQRQTGPHTLRTPLRLASLRVYLHATLS